MRRTDSRAAQRWNQFYQPQPELDIFTGVSLAEQIKEVEREIAMRRRVYPNLKIKTERTTYQLRCMEAVLATLKARQ